jgi:hypothetical protein
MLSGYLKGESLTMEQTTIRDKAIRQFGFPPEPIDYAPPIAPDPTVPPVTDALPVTPPVPPVAGLPATGTDTAPPNANPATGYTGPPTKQGTPPLTHQTRGKSDDSPAELSRLYFPGYNIDQARALIRGANPALAVNQPFPIGTRVKIPAWVNPAYFKATSAARNATQIAVKNGTSAAHLRDLNPGMVFPVKVGTRVRVK